MFNNFTKSDLNNVSKFVKNQKILTQNTKVKEFEKKWSKWLGVKHSVFVNSGSSANFLSLLCLKIINGAKGEVIVPSLTWISDIVSVIQNGFEPVFTDINLKTLYMKEEDILIVQHYKVWNWKIKEEQVVH